MLKQVGLPENILEEIPGGLNKFKLPGHRPMIRTTLAKFFNHMVQTGIFFLFGEPFQLHIDELFKYKSCDMIANEFHEVLCRTFMSSWCRFFGPPVVLKTDQEGALTGTEFATVCDRLMIQLMLVGSTEKHTVTGTVERYISIVKAIMLKMCKHCNKFRLPGHRPTLRTTYAKFFNHMVQTDIFFLFGKAFQLYIDELFKHKSGDMIANKSYEVLYRTFMSSWCRFPDSPVVLKTDQEGALTGTEFATVCDRLMIQLMLAGSTEKHTVTAPWKDTSRS